MDPKPDTSLKPDIHRYEVNFPNQLKNYYQVKR